MSMYAQVPIFCLTVAINGYSSIFLPHLRTSLRALALPTSIETLLHFIPVSTPVLLFDRVLSTSGLCSRLSSSRVNDDAAVK